MQNVKDKRVTVAGLGRFGGGIAVTRWLAEQGAHVLVTDRDPADKLSTSVAQLAGLPITYRFGQHHTEDFTSTDLVVANPAMPISSPFLAASRDAGVPITTEIRLFIERCPATIVAVTGTKGKSTTTTLLSKMLSQKFQVWLGGNIGKSLLADLPQIESHDLVVLELSSYMLEYLRPMRWSPHIALITNLSVDHVDWHGSPAAYIASKKTILEFQRRDDYAIINESDETSIELAESTPAKVEFFGTHARKPFSLRLPGNHNQLNAQAAFTAAHTLGISFAEAQSAIQDFPGLPHRLELVHEEHNIRYYNDSIATIPDAAIAALDSFPPNTVLQIIGGYDKKLPMDSLCSALASRAKAILTIGITGPSLAKSIRELNPAAVVHECQDLATAVPLAQKLASPQDNIVLSPGCASYDQFTNFEQRGEAFKQLIKSSGSGT
ncbi:MAG TPA: UDP-N-acetylmuramoyl-L-alanine--D-glutamate ligase [Tepidisphaeraceae bacterium]|jgi:UDP-N-acetylmuramoylalanine--D-glutamate ligase|nr:UDP-N-acetylmuramoyl-L-alanine--D-glutamate ligase [Tepidisphaeraceae bacterium]